MNFAHNLFLLMFNLSQLHSRSKIIELFVDGMNDAFRPVKFNYLPEKGSENDMEIKTRNSFFGVVEIENEGELSDENRSLIQNAVQMLAVILERLVFDENRNEEKLSIEKIAEERNVKLQQTVGELKKARKASLNLIEDLTEEIEKRRKSENELKESEERFRLVMENSLDAILITNPDGSILNANKAACDMFQMTEEELTRAGREGIVNLDDPNLLKFTEERKKKGHVSGELTFFRKNGSLFPTEITSSIYKTGKGELRNSLIIRDITQRKKHEEDLKESEERFSTAFKASPAPLVISDIESGLIIDVNNRWIEMLGYPREEQIGKTSKEVGIWRNPSERDRLIQQVLQNGSFKNEYIEFNTKGGEVIIALWSAETIMQSGRKVMLSMIHDITERVKAENELRRLKENLEVEVEEKTSELRERIAELERFQNATIEREFRIKELREEIKLLKDPEL
ncbi:PAS domain S-box-containing protein [Tangfeifania diversioriginum]|uniref:PAS domain S-box-containing protein n=1 Tax=Tangfeifania diversioriginum TaxID=1168035 RepID=A0A1M6I1E4_9BACT|nr:PAS domain-containing protein [Tangfeifania diversioriginum]SHJ28247.1 PAS domain S-box-containing protein [Tangfeifania diversioriginum]